MPMVDAQAAALAEFQRRQQGSVPGAPGAPGGPPAPPRPALAPPPAADSLPGAAPPSKKMYPPVAPLELTWQDPDGLDQNFLLEVRILSFDETVAVGKLMALRAAPTLVDNLPDDDRFRLRCIATCEIMWPKTMPEAVRWAVYNDPDVAFELYAAVEAHRRLYFRRNDAAGDAPSAGPRVVARFLQPASPPTE